MADDDVVTTAQVDEPDALHDRCLRCGRDFSQGYESCPYCPDVTTPARRDQ